MSGRNNRTNLSEPHAVRLARFKEMAKAQITALGAAIKERREVVGLSANRLARQFPVDPRTVARWEDSVNRYCPPSPVTPLDARTANISQPPDTTKGIQCQ